jgi:hypothetical protein
MLVSVMLADQLFALPNGSFFVGAWRRLHIVRVALVTVAECDETIVEAINADGIMNMIDRKCLRSDVIHVANSAEKACRRTTRGSTSPLEHKRRQVIGFFAEGEWRPCNR